MRAGVACNNSSIAFGRQEGDSGRVRDGEADSGLGGGGNSKWLFRKEMLPSLSLLCFSMACDERAVDRGLSLGGIVLMGWTLRGRVSEMTECPWMACILK